MQFMLLVKKGSRKSYFSPGQLQILLYIEVSFRCKWTDNTKSAANCKLRMLTEKNVWRVTYLIHSFLSEGI